MVQKVSSHSATLKGMGSWPIGRQSEVPAFRVPFIRELGVAQAGTLPAALTQSLQGGRGVRPHGANGQVISCPGVLRCCVDRGVLQVSSIGNDPLAFQLAEQSVTDFPNGRSRFEVNRPDTIQADVLEVLRLPARIDELVPPLLAMGVSAIS
ncbi:hypothetical protein AB0950_06165 [Streptomyces sp. NPDC007189]|uniref:hypothetical protein n=1 Tax=Streptomyces sp. NPDC007189 TaxID=3154315 RepID=UPI003451CDE3